MQSLGKTHLHGPGAELGVGCRGKAGVRSHAFRTVSILVWPASWCLESCSWSLSSCGGKLTSTHGRGGLHCPAQQLCVCVYACTRVCTCVCARVCVHARNGPSWIPSLTFGRGSLASSAQAGGSAALRAAKTSFSGRQGPPYTAGACPQAQGASSWGANWVPQDSLEPIGGIETCVLLQRHGGQRDLG